MGMPQSARPVWSFLSKIESLLEEIRDQMTLDAVQKGPAWDYGRPPWIGPVSTAAGKITIDDGGTNYVAVGMDSADRVDGPVADTLPPGKRRDVEELVHQAYVDGYFAGENQYPQRDTSKTYAKSMDTLFAAPKWPLLEDGSPDWEHMPVGQSCRVLPHARYAAKREARFVRYDKALQKVYASVRYYGRDIGYVLHPFYHSELEPFDPLEAIREYAVWLANEEA